MASNLFVDVKATIYTKILIRTLLILVRLGLISIDDGEAYLKKKAVFKTRIGNSGKWSRIV